MINIKNILIVCISLVMYSVIFSSCKSDEIGSGIFEIAPKDLIVDVDKESTTVYIPISSSLTINDWEVDYKESWITHGKKRNSLVLSFEANPDKNKRTASIKITSPVAEYTLAVNQYGENDVVITDDKDVKVKPERGMATEPANPNNDIENTWDDSPRPYMTYQVPATLEYFFSGTEIIDYIVYTPTSSGNFGKVKVYTATAENPDYTSQGEYDFEMKSESTTIRLSTGIKASKIKFEVQEGKNDMIGCSEMEFFTKTISLTEQLLTVFTDVLCTELKPDVDDTAIEKLPAEYFKRIAYSLKDGRYNEWEKEFRIQEYKAYSNNEDWARKLFTKKYTDLDNPTGITVKEGDELIVLVGDTHEQNISLQIIGEQETDFLEDHFYLQPNYTGDRYTLKPGINKLVMGNTGQLFIMYNTDITSPNALPIKIHIPLGSGKVTGYFDPEKHKTDEKYAELLSKATHKYFCIRGERIMFYFHTDELQEVIPRKILPSLDFWNNIIKWQQELMGIENVQPTQMNNHIFAISPEGAYMWASDYRIAFAKNTLNKILVPERLMAEKDNVWGPAHEIGHVHQGAINWPSCSESSNNIFSNYVLYKLGKYCSRGLEISKLAESYQQKKPWALLGTSTHQNEDTELHMRMQWQLWNYFHRLGHMPDFFPKLFQELRTNPLNSSPGFAQMDYAKAVCKIANMDMTEFFERWGFFREVMIPDYEQYGKHMYIVNQGMIDQTKEYMKTFSKKCPPICYLEDRKNGDVGIENYQVGDVGHYSQFKDNVKITGTPTYKLAGSTITINNGEQAVAFEARKDNENGELLFFFNFLSYTIPQTIINETTKFYAVQADGKRIEMKKE
ncbi:M60 family metallopeptidase [uncultured Bacteroides sp.]|uniref:M60 family metallopeptidase n=1 Tax=uncultured Bacteroides sp. TaxID=162156 RepID=UPI0025CF5A08|nr:M60 family metallopeptidase [uncultured Bacteroides sp.]